MPPDPAPPSGAAGSLSALEALFHQGMELPPAQRAAWAEQQLANDPRQAALLRRMLEHAEAEATGMARAIGQFASDSAAPRDRAGERIGRYRLIARIRYGGMAEVYRAARDDGEFEHEVALKVVRSDRVRPELNDLFAAERALMARLKHPHVIQIFDGGTTAQGEAWFVMELLDGLPLPAAIARHALGGDQVLGHLLNLCSALAHVHAQLIVHRDIKPENVLLCRTPQGLAVKLLDFGIAARLGKGLASGDATTVASTGDGWYSPGYAAPEAREGQPHGAAADVYSLGRLLLDCVELVPPRYREELRAIGEQASRAEPEQRYASASSVAEDLARLRRREPISLFRQRRVYVLRRALQRHRWAVAASLVVVLAGATWMWRESGLRVAAEQATARAEAERDRAGTMRDFLLDVFESGNPRLNRGEDPRVSDLIAGQLDRLQEAKGLDPDAHYDLLSTFGDLLLHLDRRDLADRAFLQAATLTESQGGQGNARWAAMTTRRGQVAARDGRFDEADQWFGQARDALDRLPESVERAQVASVLYSSWGANAQRRGNLDQAERLIRTGLEAKRILQAANDPGGDESAMRVTLGAIQSARGDQVGALETFQAAYDNHRAAGFSDTLEHLALLGWLGITFDRLGRAPEAEPYLIEAVALAEKLFPQPNSRLSGSYANLGRLYLNQGRLADAEPLLRRALEVSEAAGDGETPNHASRLHLLGLLAFEAERTDEAIKLLGQSLALAEARLGASHPRTLATRLALATARAEMDATVSLQADVDGLLAAIDTPALRSEALLLAARLAATRGQTAKAQTALDEAAVLLAAADPALPEHAQRLWMQGRALLALNQHDAARDALQQAAAAFQASGREQHPGRGRALLQAALLSPAGSADRASLGEQARAILEHQLQPPATSLALLDSL
jgi:eukaryotic-like serine/threonine-protein kinase